MHLNILNHSVSSKHLFLSAGHITKDTWLQVWSSSYIKRWSSIIAEHAKSHCTCV